MEENSESGAGKLFLKGKYEPFLWTYSFETMNITLEKNSLFAQFSLSSIERGLLFKKQDKETLSIRALSPYLDPSFEYWRGVYLVKDKISYFDS